MSLGISDQMEACESNDGIVDNDVCLQSPSNVFDVGATHLFPVLSEPGLIYTFDANDSSSDGDTKQRPAQATQQKAAPAATKTALPSSTKKVDYQFKYERLKRQIKDTIFMNAAIRDDVTFTESQLLKAKQERKVLLKKMFQYLPMTESQAMQSAAALKSIAGSFDCQLPPSILDPVNSTTSHPQSPKRKKRLTTKPSGSSDSEGSRLKQQTTPGSADASRPKRRKPGTAMNRKVHRIPRDAQGVPVFPIALGSLMVHDLGVIVHTKPGFHSERYLWPAGFCSSRSYPSMLNPDLKVCYTCKIVDNGSDPSFQIVAEDDTDNPISAATATACHCAVLKRLNRARGKDATNTGSGPEFFGFSHPTIQYLLQCLPNADKCWKYNWVQFELPTGSPVAAHSLSSVTSGGGVTDGDLSPSPPPSASSLDADGLERNPCQLSL